MAKILVADDNSNVQKTVALALADLGVEVVAVNNGDAAVRKLGDVMPDLVLADIFMPVRNGYEVCEYVKKDSRFANVPVVLLVGAFDPLDEREAQRVGADGILKKPFVPPDPLIMMVKTLLERTHGERLVAVGAPEKPAVAAQAKASGSVATAVQRPPAPAIPEIEEEIPAEEFKPPVERLSFGDGERPMAFGQLLDAPAKESGSAETGVIEPVDDDQILTSSRDASLGDPIFWRTEEPEKESEEENSDAEGDERSSEPPMRAWKPGDGALPGPAETDFVQPVEPFELVRDDKDQEVAQATTIVESSASLLQDPASQASLNVDSAKPADLAANPIEWMASVPPTPAEEIPEAVEEWNPAASDSAEEIVAKETASLKEEPKPVAPETPVASVSSVSSLASALTSALTSSLTSDLPPETLSAMPSATPEAKSRASEISDPDKTQPNLKPLDQSAEDTARSIPKQEWADMAASLQPKSTDAALEKTREKAEEKSKPSAEIVAKVPTERAAGIQTPSPSSAAPSASPISTSLEQSAEDTARSISKHDWADMAAGLQSKPAEAVAEKQKTSTSLVSQAPATPAASSPVAPSSASQIPSAEVVSTPPAAATSTPAAAASVIANSTSVAGTPDPALVEAVVQRILEKMRPQVVDIITKEFLRPIVQALVHREIEKH